MLLFFFLIGSGIQTTQAQFWKKLKKRVKDGVEEAVLRKTEEKTTEKTEKTIDTIFAAPKKLKGKNKKGKKNSKNKSDVKNIPKNLNLSQNEDTATLPNGGYNFEWRYTLKMDSEAMRKKAKRDLKITYYLSPNTAVFASKFDMGDKNEMQNMMMVINPTTGSNLMLMEMNGQKIRQKMPSFSGQETDDLTEEQVEKNYTIVKTDTKTILGYQCQGFKITSSDGIIQMYIAKDAPISFNRVLAGSSQFKPKGFNPKWLKEFKNGLMMEMQFTSNKKKKYNMKMTCIALVQEPFSINLSEYKSFMNMGNTIKD